MSKISRRSFFKKASATTLLLSTENPVGMLFNQVINSVARAETIESKRFISFSALGGPPRWMFDLILRLDDSPLNISPMVGTTLHQKNNGEISTSFEFAKKITSTNGVVFFPPIMWDHHFPSGTGLNLKVREIFKKAMIIRGVRTSANHPPAVLNTHVNGFSKSGVHTLAQEQLSNRTPVSCVQYGVNYPFKPRNKASCLNIKYETDEGFNPIEKILRPFMNGEKNDKNFNNNLKKIFNDAFAELFKSEKIKTFSDSERQRLEQDHISAQSLFIQNTKNLIEIYPSTYEKYVNLINTILDDENMIFLGDGKLPPQSAPSQNNLNYHKRSLCSFDQINSLSKLFSSTNANMNQMASAFALTEILCKENGKGTLSGGLTNSIVTSLGELKFNEIRSVHPLNQTLNIKTNYSLQNDAHQMGSVITTYGFSVYFLAFAGCLSRFIKDGLGDFDSLKFKNTIIQLSSDFDRTPRSDETGSDHSPHTTFTYFSGAIHGPIIGGACQVNSKSQYLDHGESYTKPITNTMNCMEGVSHFLGVEPLTNSIEKMFHFSENKIILKNKYVAKNIDMSEEDE